MIKTRFAPSPTGFLHVGSLRTALFEYLFAKNQNGKFLLRVEDTDRERYVEGGVENMLYSLAWAGIEPDEGVILEDYNIAQTGENGPYIQSERLDIYKKYLDQLLDQGHAYHCFCTKERLDELREYQQVNKMAPGYDGHCREIPLEEAKKRVEAGEEYIVRMKMPKDGVTVIKDIVRGEIEFKNQLVDDQVLLKADGFPTYHLAVIIDDHLMEVTHIIRGEEWLPSTPKHIQLYKMFGWDLPQYAHLSLLVNEKKQKLSKRHGHVSVRDYIDAGYLPEAMVNFIAFLGWNPGDEREIFSLEQLIKEFDFNKVSKAPAVFNLDKLDWYNQQYIRSMDLDDLVEACKPFLVNAGLDIGHTDIDLEQVVALEKERMNKLSDLPEAVGFIFAGKLEYDSELLIWKKSDKQTTKKNLEILKDYLSTFSVQDWDKEKLEQGIVEWVKTNELTNGEVLWPMRVALSGRKNSPGPFEIAGVLGKEKVLQRIEEAIRIVV
ncbi:MAG: glutamate--tRNA ligase [bacterium]